jgi:methyl-accepting chemotaxis protein
MFKMNSIRFKIIAPLAIFILGIAAFNVYYFPSREAGIIKSVFEERLRQAVNTLALGTSISISSGSLEGARATVQLLKHDKDIAFLFVLDADGAELISDGQMEEGSQVQSLEQLAGLPQAVFVERKPYLLLKQEIIFEDELLGAAIVGLNTRERERLIHESILFTIIVNVILAALGIGVILWVTQSVILSSVRETVEAAQAIATGDRTVQMGGQRQDEMGQLSNAINLMAGN